MNKLNSPEEYRGFFITHFAKLERAIDLYLAKHFIPHDALGITELIEILIDRITFNDKRTALRFLIEQKDDENFKNGKHGNKNKNHKKMIEKIGEMARLRNEFAHYLNADFRTFPDIEFGFVKYRDSTQLIKYGVSDFYKIIEDLKECTKTLNDLMDQ